MGSDIIDKGLPIAVLFQWRHPVSLALSCLVVAVQLNAQVQFADNKPVICPAGCTTHSLCHSDILSVLPSYYDTISEMSVSGARMQP